MFRSRILPAALALMAAASALPAMAQEAPALREGDRVRGAIYVPTDAYNAPQMWKHFDAQEVERDLGYAQQIHINALRVWASYEYWRAQPKDFEAKFDRFLQIASAHGMQVLIALFENDGVSPTPQHMWSTDPANAFSIQSPGTRIATGPESGWAAPREFVVWFMKRYGSDPRLMAIELMNEPRKGKDGAKGTIDFTKSMLATASAMRGSVPLTVGTARIGEARDLIAQGMDIIQFHNNFPRDRAGMKKAIEEAIAMQRETGHPVWLTEWQRVRPGGNGRGAKPVTASERGPDYASLAPTVNAYPIPTFVWSLMVKRAYLQRQRKMGTVNGLFWPDGSVVSLKDARAIAEDPTLQLREKPIPADFGLEGLKQGASD